MNGPAVRRRSTAQLRALARDVITNRKMVTDDPRVIESAFMMMVAFGAFSGLRPGEVAAIGALIGDYNEIVPGRGVNGYPIFLSMGYLHINDVARFNAIVDQMQEALA